MKQSWAKLLPVRIRTTTAIALLLLSVPFVMLSGLLAGAVFTHERQFGEAEQMLTLFRSGLVALKPMEEMRTLSRPGSLPYPDAAINTRFVAARQQAEQELQHLFALTHRYAARAPGVAEPLKRLEDSVPSLEATGASTGSNAVMGPHDIITQVTDNTYALLASMLYTASLPEGEKTRSVEMLLLIPDTLHHVRDQLSVLQALAYPTTMNVNGLSNNDITILDQSFGNLILLLDTLDSQLQSIARRGGLGVGDDPLKDVRSFQDDLEQDYVFKFARWDMARADTESGKANVALDIITTALVDTAAANLHSAQWRQRWLDLATVAGLLLLYAALAYLSVLFFRTRDAAQHAREMAKEIAERKRRENELRQLNQLSELLMACQSCPEAYEVFGRSAAALFAGSNGALAVMSADIDKLLTVTEWGDASRLAASFSLDHCRAMEQGLPQFVTTPGPDDHCQHFQTPPESRHICLPLVMQDRPLGLLWLECGSEEESMEGSVQLATSAGETLKLALANIRLREALHEQSIRDVLTGLYNRRHLHDSFGRELAQACRSGQSLALALLDIDHFKQVNDCYGHEAGDQALKALSEHLRHGLRASDLCFRHGGEEFVLLLHTDQDGAMKCVDNLRRNFHARSFQFGEHPGCQLSFSAGVVEAPLMADTLEELLQLADTALYRAKAEGRNRVLMATAEA